MKLKKWSRSSRLSASPSREKDADGLTMQHEELR